MPELKRALGLKELTIYGVGVILGAGIYALIGEGAGLTGNSLWLSFLMGAIIASFTGLSYAELSSLFPKEAAEFVYVKNAFGSRMLAFLLSWIILIAGVSAVATVALGFAGYFVYMFFGGAGSNFASFLIFSVSPLTLVAMLIVAVMSYFNYKGISESAKLNIIFTLIEVGGLLFIVFIGLPHWGSVDYFELGNGVSGLMGAMAVTFFAYIGFEGIANISEEVKNASSNVPKAIVLALVLTTVLYILVSVSAVSIVSSSALAESDAPLAFVAEQGFSGSGGVLSIIALFATANTVLVFLIIYSRIVYGVAVNKSFPDWLARIDPRTHTPHLAILVVMFFAMLFCTLSSISIVAQLANFGLFVTFFMINLSHLILRYKNSSKRSFRTPLNIGRFPVLSFLGVVSCFAAMASYFVVEDAGGWVFVLTDSVKFFLFLLASGFLVFFLLKR